MSEHFRAWWPITDPTMTLDELAAEAVAHHLPELLRRNRYRLAGRGRWSIHHGRDLPGTGGAHLVLVADLPIVRLQRPIDPPPEEAAA